MTSYFVTESLSNRQNRCRAKHGKRVAVMTWQVQVIVLYQNTLVECRFIYLII